MRHVMVCHICNLCKGYNPSVSSLFLMVPPPGCCLCIFGLLQTAIGKEEEDAAGEKEGTIRGNHLFKDPSVYTTR